MTKVELDNYFTQNYSALAKRYGAGTVNGVYISYIDLIKRKTDIKLSDLENFFRTQAYYQDVKEFKFNSKKIPLNLNEDNVSKINEYTLDTNKLFLSFNYLTKVQWEAINKHYFKEMQVIDIAREKGVSGNLISVNLNSAISKLRKLMGVT